MFGLSTIWLRVIGAAVIAVLVGGVLWGTYAKGYAARDTEAKLEMSQALLRAHKKTNELQVAFDGLKSKVLKERKNAETRIANLNTALRAGELRLYFDTSRQPGPRDPGVEPGTERAQLGGQASEFLIGLAAEGDQALRERNLCIAQYNEVKERLNGRQRTD